MIVENLEHVHLRLIGAIIFNFIFCLVALYIAGEVCGTHLVWVTKDSINYEVFQHVHLVAIYMFFLLSVRSVMSYRFLVKLDKVLGAAFDKVFEEMKVKDGWEDDDDKKDLDK